MPRELKLIKQAKTTTIDIATKPPLLGGEPVTVRVEEFARKNNFTWIDDMLLDESLETDYQTMMNAKDFKQQVSAYAYLSADNSPTSQTASITKSHVDNLLVSPKFKDELLQKSMVFINSDAQKQINQAAAILPHLVICDIDKKVGKGVFLKKTSFAIKKGTVVALYTGVYKSSSLNSGVYELDTQSHPLFENNDKCFSRAIGVIDAENYGGIARFIQSMPGKNQLSAKFKLDPDKEKVVATANLDAESFYCNGMNIFVLIAADDIQPGEQLGFYYGDKFWSDPRRKELLFDKKGGLLPENQYQYKTVFSSADFVNQMSLFSHLHLNSISPTPNQPKSQYVYTPQNYREEFIYTVKKLLQQHLSLCGNHTDSLSRQKIVYLQELLAIVERYSSHETDKMYLALHGALKEPSKESFYRKNLTSLWQEFVSAMKLYNESKKAENDASKRPSSSNSHTM